MDETERKALARAASGARPIGAYAARALDPPARARGFATTALLGEWPAIVGAELAEFTMPDRLVWPRRHQDSEEPAPKKGLARGRGNSGAQSRGPSRHRGAAPFRRDPRAGQHLFRLSGRRRNAHPASACHAETVACVLAARTGFHGSPAHVGINRERAFAQGAFAARRCGTGKAHKRLSAGLFVALARGPVAGLRP